LFRKIRTNFLAVINDFFVSNICIYYLKRKKIILFNVNSKFFFPKCKGPPCCAEKFGKIFFYRKTLIFLPPCANAIETIQAKFLCPSLFRSRDIVFTDRQTDGQGYLLTRVYLNVRDNPNSVFKSKSPSARI
jgi:hypothetical protein